MSFYTSVTGRGANLKHRGWNKDGTRIHESVPFRPTLYVPTKRDTGSPWRTIDGKVVEVEGYLAFPLMVSETKELLVMLNQWDGCCIGVPPTPYDAIEVKLAEPAKRGGKHASFNFGGVRGTLKVDPYLVENWLVGLYVMENAQMVEGAKPEL